MTTLLRRLMSPWFWLLLGGAAAMSGWLSERNPSVGLQADRSAARVEANFQQLDRQLLGLLSDTALLGALARAGEQVVDIPAWRDSPFALYVFQEGQLRWWNTHHVLPNQPEPDQAEGRLVRLSNGFYTARSAKGPGYLALGLIPVRYEYSVQNRYLRPAFSDALNIPEEALLLNPDLPGNSIRNAEGQVAFSLHFPPSAPSTWSATLIPELLALMAPLVTLLLLARNMARRGHALVSAMVLGGIFVLLRTILLKTGWPGSLFETPLFDPHYYASPEVAPSLGHLMLDGLLALLFSLFLMLHAAPDQFPLPAAIRVPLGAVLLLLLFRIAVWVLYTLVADSNISFDLDNFLGLDGFSLAGLLTAALLLGSVFALGSWLYSLWASGSSLRYRLSTLALSWTVLSLLFALGEPLMLWMALLFCSLFIGIKLSFERGGRAEYSLGGMLLWTAFFAAMTAGLLLRTASDREQSAMSRYAMRIASDQDPVMEYLFGGVAAGLRQDVQVRSLFADAYPAWRLAEEHILQVHLNPYFDRYRIGIFGYAADGQPLHSDSLPSRASLDSLIEQRGVAADSEGLFKLEGLDRLEYLARIPVRGPALSSGSIYIRLQSRVLAGEGLYPELLLRDAGLSLPPDYDYALYRNGRLTARSGEYPFPLVQPASQDAPGTMRTEHIDGRYRLLYRSPNDISVWIDRPQDPWTLPFSLFSYVFLFLLLLASLFLLPAAAIRQRAAQGPSRESGPGGGISLRGRIQTFALLLTLLSFVIIGAITLTYFNRQSEDYQRNRLQRKIRAVAAELEYEAGKDAQSAEPLRRSDSRWPFDQGIRADFGALSSIHGIDINIYDTLGALLHTSQPDVFKKGLLGPVMEPSAWRALHQQRSSHWVQEERIGSLPFLSAYLPLQSESGLTTAYLHTPYFAQEKNRRQEASGFLVALVNVYVLLLVAAGLVALTLSNSVTRSLSEIAARFRQIRVGERNEPILWSRRDEIGLLVSEYNKMLGELERSAALLARSERESAWREMARQVAHEIKNPLTPMRLSIQHLQRALQSGDPRAEELTRRVSQTLLEQIDTLSHIATEFSNFAQMPRPQADVVELGEVLRSAVQLYDAHEEADFHLALPGSPCPVYADREQLLRVFSNLLKNALQAIPDERRGRIEVSMAAQGQRVQVQVRDNGTGIPEEQQHRVFAPNFTTKSSGMGLGLALCKNMVEQASGSIRFSTVPGQGTVFTVELPLSSSRPSPNSSA
jgi:two-component system nitrogen regulation sensor histidine kinase NtrY